MSTPAPAEPEDGRRFFAALFGVGWMALPASVLAANAWHWVGWGGSVWDVLWLLLPTGAWLGWRFGAVRGSRSWKRLCLACCVVAGAGFGHAMEGWEGCFWGALIGLAVGFGGGLYTPWIASVLPARWGVVAAWSLLGISLVLVPLLVGMRLFLGDLDDDDLPFVILAACGGVFLAASRGWWRRGTIRRTDLMAILKAYGCRWLDLRVWPWVLAFFVAGLVAGGNYVSFGVEEGAALDIWIEPRSWWWPCALLLAGLWGIAVSRRRRSALNGGYFILCVLVTVAVSVELVCMARYRVHVDERALDLRFGLFHSLTLERGGLESIETKVAHGRRYRLHYPVLVTTQGRRIGLRHVSRRHEVWFYLERAWGMPGVDGQR